VNALRNIKFAATNMESRLNGLGVTILVALLSTYGVQGQATRKTTDGKDCVFPFTYNDVVYNDCTTVSNDGVEWCSLTADYMRDRQYGTCAPRETIQTTDGGTCVFPFIYGNVPRYTCIDDANGGVLWCGKTSNYDQEKLWGNCVISSATTTPTTPTETIRTTDGGVCVFPFIYGNTPRTTCIDDNNNGVLWCGKTSNYDQDRSWGNCVIETIRTTDGGICVFPFIYGNVPRYTCIDDANGGVLWCGKTSNYDQDKSWGNCVITTDVIKTTDGRDCAIPFIYQNIERTSCITDGNGNVPWCSTTRNYDNDRQWGNCAQGQTTTTTPSPTGDCPFFTKYANTVSTTGQSLQGTEVNNLKLCWDRCMTASNCVGFEFRKSTNRCYVHTTSGDFNSVVTNTDYDQYRKTEVDCDTIKTEANVACVFPFLYNGNYITECTTEGTSTGKPWCATTANYNTATSQWGYCKAAKPTVYYTENGDMCAIPFTYGGQTYTECTTAGGETKPWCALDTVYQSGRWGYCRDDGQTPDDCMTYSVYTDTRSSGANPARVTTATSRQMCRDDCDGNSACVGFEFGGSSFNECYRHTNRANMESQSGRNTAYDQFRKVAASCSVCMPWEASVGLDAPGGTLVAGNYPLNLCREACIRRTGCIGIDFLRSDTADVTDSTRGVCYWHTDSTVVNRLTSNARNIFYKLNIGCTGCVDYFTRVPASDSRNSANVVQSSVTDETGCFSACLREPGCTAFDVSVNSANQFVCDLTSDVNVRANAVYGNTAFTLYVRESCEDINATPAPPTTIMASNGKACVFPFTYKGSQYSSCTTVDYSEPWCATASVYSASEWGTCILDTSSTTTPDTTPTGTPTTPSTVEVLTENGEKCALPFVYNGVTYDSCLLGSVGKTWCSLDSVYNNRWGYCVEQGTTTPTSANQVFTEGGQQCVFPFSYGGQQYTSCTIDGSSIGKEWCGIVSVVDGNNPAHWGYCATSSTNCVRGFKMYSNQYSANQVFTAAGTTQTACNDLCLGQPTCLGYDWMNNACYFHRNADDFTSSNTFSSTVSTQYRKEDCGNDPGACFISMRFQTFTGTGSNRGIVKSTLTTLADCLNGCRADTSCLGADFNGPNPANDRCYFHTNAADFAAPYVYQNVNVNQYRKQSC
jgi:hypothetical protein